MGGALAPVQRKRPPRRAGGGLVRKGGGAYPPPGAPGRPQFRRGGSADGLPHGVSPARRGGDAQPGDREIPRHQSPGGEVARAPITTLSPPAAGALPDGGGTGNRKSC